MMGRRARKGRRRQSADFQLSTTSDVAFLLLIFFISTAIFVSPYGLSIILPSAGAAPEVVAAEDVADVLLDSGGRIQAGGEERNAASLASWAASLQQSRPSVVFRLRVHPDCPYAAVVEGVDALTYAEARRITFAAGGAP